MKTVLLVDDDRGVLQVGTRALLTLKDLSVVTAGHGAIAIQILQEQPIDLIVTDLQMPVMGGYQLLNHVAKHYPGLPAIVMTSFLDLNTWSLSTDLGAMRVLSKPVVPNVLQQEVLTLLKREPEGWVKGIGVGNLLMLMHWEGKTCTMTARTRDRIGMLYLQSGHLVHATCRDRRGEAAAFEILSWDSPQVTFVEACRLDSAHVVDIPGLLMKASLRRDERRSAPEMPAS